MTNSVNAKPIYTSFGFVSDGDTISVKKGNEIIRMRLAFIDAPESGQQLGKTAQAYLASLLKGDLTFTEYGKDRYGRKLVEVYADGVLVNVQMVRSGLAYFYAKYCKKNCNYNLYKEAQDKAKWERRGVWDWNYNDELPEDYRHHVK